MGNRSCGLDFRRGVVMLSALGAGVGGCAPHPGSAPASRAAARRVQSEARTLTAITAAAGAQVLPGYEEARKACGRGEYRKAAGILAGMQRAHGLDGDEREFLHRQEMICLGHLTPRKTVTPSPAHPLTLSPSQRAAPFPAQSADCGPRALLWACISLSVKADLVGLTKAARTDSHGTSLKGLQDAAASVGLKAEGVQVSREALPDVPTPCIGWTNRDHYVVVCGFNGRGEHGTATIQDPNEISPHTISCERLLQATSGYLLVLHR